MTEHGPSSPSTPKRRERGASAQSSGAEALRLMKDRLGSIINILDENEALKTTYSYDAFGEPTATYHSGQVDCMCRFAGREFDTAMGNYSKVILAEAQPRPRVRERRLSARDPMMSLGSLYAYCNNSPENLKDPTGMACSDQKTYQECISCCENKRALAELNAYVKRELLYSLANAWDIQGWTFSAGCALGAAQPAATPGGQFVLGAIGGILGEHYEGGYYHRTADRIREKADRMFKAAMNKAAAEEQRCKGGCSSKWPGSSGETTMWVTFQLGNVPAP